MKPLLPFPIPLNIGTDICQISRIYGILNSPRATRFVHRILAPDEKSRNDPRLQVLQRARECLHHDKKLAGKEQIPHDHRKIETGDPELWKCAAFIAGRFVYVLLLTASSQKINNPSSPFLQVRRERGCHQSPPAPPAHVPRRSD